MKVQWITELFEQAIISEHRVDESILGLSLGKEGHKKDIKTTTHSHQDK